MSNNRHRVEIPTNPSEIIALLEAIKTKHEALGAASPLAGLKWTEIGPAHATAKEQNQLSIDLRRQAEAATGARDAKLPSLTEAVRSARDILMGLNRDNPDALGEFGFDVADARSSAAPPVPPSALGQDDPETEAGGKLPAFFMPRWAEIGKNGPIWAKTGVSCPNIQDLSLNVQHTDRNLKHLGSNVQSRNRNVGHWMRNGGDFRPNVEVWDRNLQYSCPQVEDWGRNVGPWNSNVGSTGRMVAASICRNPCYLRRPGCARQPGT